MPREAGDQGEAAETVLDDKVGPGGWGGAWEGHTRGGHNGRQGALVDCRYTLNHVHLCWESCVEIGSYGRFGFTVVCAVETMD